MTDIQEIRKIAKEELASFKLNESIQKLDIKDGDILAVFYEGYLSKELHDNLCKSLKEILKRFGLNINVLIFEGGMKVGILR